MKKLVAALLALALTSPFLSAQSSGSASEEDMIVLSPFEVSSEASASYLSTAGSSGSRSDFYSANLRPDGQRTAPVTLVRRADAVVIQFALSNTADKPEVRNQALYSTIRDIQAALAKVPGLRMEQREIRFAGGRSKTFSFGRGSQTSYASILIFADLVPELRLADRVKQVRDAIDQVRLSPQTKLIDGTAGLYLKDVSSYRREILQKIFDDLAFVKKGLGDEFEVLPAGLSQPVNLRACSETDVELWIDYSFTINSVRALTNPKK